MEPTPYMTAVTDARALMLSQEEATEGLSLLSLETTDLEHDAAAVLFREHLGVFLRYLRLLPKLHQDLLLGYYLLHKPQTSLAGIYPHLSQTMVSSNIMTGVRALSAIATWGGMPSVEQLRPILVGAGLESIELAPSHDNNVGIGGRYVPMRLRRPIPVSVSELLTEYVVCRSFSRIADRHCIHRPEVKRTFRMVSDKLLESKDPIAQATGAWVALLIEKASPTGTGLSKAAQKKLGDIRRSDSDSLGLFRIDVQSEGFNEWFSPRSST